MQDVTAWTAVFTNWGHSERNEINGEHKKVKKGARGGLGQMAAEPEPQSPSKELWKPTQEIKQLRLRAMSRGLLEEQIIFSTKPKRDYWAQYRNAQRTFLCAQGKFPNFLDKDGQQILRKSLCGREDSRKERRADGREEAGNFDKNSEPKAQKSLNKQEDKGFHLHSNNRTVLLTSGWMLIHIIPVWFAFIVRDNNNLQSTNI